MGRFLRRFLISHWIVLILLGLAAVAACNGYLVLRARVILRLLNAAAPCRASFSDIYFLPPRHIFVKNVRIIAEEGMILEVPKMRMDVSFFSLLCGKPLFSGVCLHDPVVNAPAAAQFSRRNSELILALLAKAKISCGIFSARRCRIRDTTISGPTDIDLSFREGSFSGRGSFAVPLSLFPFRELAQVQALAESPISWYVRGSFSPKSFAVDKFELKGGRFSAQLWGGIEERELFCNGFLLLNRASLRRVFDVIALDHTPFFAGLKQRIEEFLLRLLLRKPEKGVARSSNGAWESVRGGEDFDMVELDCRLGLEFPRIDIKRLNLMLNRLPLSVKGSLNVGPQPSFELDFSSSMLPRETVLPYSLHGWVSGAVSPHGLRSSGEIDFESRRLLEQAAWKEMRVRFRDLSCSLRSKNRIDLSARGLWLLILQNEEKRSMRLENPRMSVFLADPRYKYLVLDASMGGGKARAQCRIDTGSPSFPLKAFARLTGARAERLKGVAPYFDHLTGEFDARLRFVSDPPMLTGRLRVAEGFLRDFEFFVWLEDFLGLPGLARVDFNSCTADFWAGNGGGGFSSLLLDASKMDIQGEYGIRGERVNGALTLSINRRLLEGTKKFKPLLKLVDRKRPKLNFSFRLSGRKESMNFLWQQSDFKRELQDAIPGFIERKIERNVERMLRDISSP